MLELINGLILYVLANSIIEMIVLFIAVMVFAIAMILDYKYGEKKYED